MKEKRKQQIVDAKKQWEQKRKVVPDLQVTLK